MAKSNGYIGKVSGKAVQVVKGPYAANGGKAGVVKKSGGDLRSGNKNK